MTARDDLDRQLAAWFVADAAREPEHLLGAVLARTARTRRRPAWRVPERWIPMSAITSRVAAAPRASLRFAVALALLILALIVGAVLLPGHQQPRELPAPFGPAANGLVAYSIDGDIHTVDPVSGRSTAIVTGPDTDSDPVWSRDGTRLAFKRTVAGESGVRLYVARADGSGLTVITPEPLPGIESFTFSPDGAEVLLVSTAGLPRAEASIARADGSGIRALELGTAPEEPAYRPPDGAEIAFVEGSSIIVANADGSNVRTLFESGFDRDAGFPQWSPDGSLLAYGFYDPTVPDWTTQVHVMLANGSGDRALPAPMDAKWSGNAVWSNDGTRLAIVRGYSPRSDEDVVVAVVPVDGSGPGVETARGLLASWPSRFEWAPDDSAILLTQGVQDPDQPLQQLLIDPDTGDARPAPWTATAPPAWQRVAP